MKPRKAVRFVFYVVALAAFLAGTAAVPGFSLLDPDPVLADSGVCAVPGKDGPASNLGGVINTYYPGTAAVAAGSTSVPVGAPAGAADPIEAGDLLLVIQMQDADIVSANDETYGDGLGTPGGTTGIGSGAADLRNAGRYEYVVADGPVAGGAVPIRNGLVYDYTDADATAASGQRRFQVIRVPQYSSAVLDPANPLEALPWNGTLGGVLVFDVAGQLDLNGGSMDVSERGFRGGGGQQEGGVDNPQDFAFTDYVVPTDVDTDAAKGEGIAGTPRFVFANPGGDDPVIDTGVDGYPGGSSARGAPANAGGGGTDGNAAANDENSGGGGGGNGGAGGGGGNSWQSNLPSGGFGGIFGDTTTSAVAPDRLVLGGGGGAGTTNNATGDLSDGQSSSGAIGGGMVLIRAGETAGTGTINANGGDGLEVDRDGAGGGGAGGSVLFLSAAGSLAGLTVNATGGDGGDSWLTRSAPRDRHGPGGGGGGGVVFTSEVPGTVDVSGGQNGVSTDQFDPYGALPGQDGVNQVITPADLPTGIAGAPCLPVITVTKTTSTPVIQNTPNGAQATYTVVFSNAAGLGTALDVLLSDQLPSGFTYNQTTALTPAGGAVRVTTENPTVGDTVPEWGRFNLPGGASVSITYVVDIAPSVTANDYVNTANVSYLDPQRTTPDGRITATDTATVTITSAPAPEADLAITKTSVGQFVIGQTGLYNLDVTNLGPDEAAAPIEVIDTLPTGLTYVSAAPAPWTCSDAGQLVTCTYPDPLAAGQSLPTLELTVQVTQNVQTGSPLVNTAEVSSPTPDPDPNNNTDTSTVSVGPLEADLAIVKTSSGLFEIGQTGLYNLAVRNDGPDAADGPIEVLDTLPTGLTYVSAAPAPWTCSDVGQLVTCEHPGPLPAGQDLPTLELTVQIGQNVPTGSPLVNTATVSSPTPDPDPNNNTDTSTVNVGQPGADLEIVKASVGDFNVGVPGLYNLDVTNNGPNEAAGPIEVVDTLPRGLSYVSAGPASWICNAVGQDVTCEHPGPLPVNQSLPTLELTVQVGESAAQASPLQNTAEVSSPTPDPDPSNNSSTDIVSVTAPLLIVTKRDALVIDRNANGQVNPGDTIEYTIDIINDGNGPARDVVFTDTPDPNTTLVVGSVRVDPAGAQVTSGNNIGDASVQVRIGTIDAGTRVTVQFFVVINVPFPDDRNEVANQGFVNSSNTPTVPSDDPDTPEPDDPTRTPVIDTGDAPPTAIVLSAFTASASEDGVLLRWVTAAEYNTWGFSIYRSSTADFADAEPVNNEVILSRGRGVGETSYEFLDSSAADGAGYTYWLVEQEVDGTTFAYGPVSVPGLTDAAGQRVFLPLIFR